MKNDSKNLTPVRSRYSEIWARSECLRLGGVGTREAVASDSERLDVEGSESRDVEGSERWERGGNEAVGWVLNSSCVG